MKTITEADRRHTSLRAFVQAEKISRTTLYRRKAADPAFPQPCYGHLYWRPALLAYVFPCVADEART